MALHSENADRAQDDKKRKMKTPLQLEVLEHVFAEEKYPSEALRARLSIQLGLSNRQLKMWFCHRRLKEKKSKGDDEEHGSSGKSPQQLNEAPLYGLSSNLTSPSLLGRVEQFQPKAQLCGKTYQLQEDLAGKFGRRLDNSEERDFESFRRKRSKYSFANSADFVRIAELQAIASVEAQLGEPLRLDSPCLGVEFDPLPAGAFSAPVVPFLPLKPSPKGVNDSSSTSKPVSWLQKGESPGEKTVKIRKSAIAEHGQVANSRTGTSVLQQYQFIPECPTGLTSAYEKSSTLKKAASVGSGLSLQGDACNPMIFPQLQLGPQDLISGVAFNAQHVGQGHSNPHYLLPPVASFHSIEKPHLFHKLETNIGNTNQKSEEIRVAKEVEAHRKQLQKDLEREELCRRKREEHLQKEREKEIDKMLKEKQREDERLLRGKQREDERLQRERQREDERLQREARRESERHERFLQKEAQRLEREREKEEARRLKEATRLKVAIERATARRIARECVELIDDERLELLEVAATSQGLPSIYLLDGETLQSLDRYKEFLKRFPPPAVKMKKPLMMSPWVDSQHNLGNLFMVWRFLMAFADVLGLWPFTLDELVQAFHDYESRLLAELHIALFKVIVKDIEDMAKASANAGAVNQYTAASTIGGGHTQLVEAAFAWGFDYRSWSRHLNASTWPEILRQFSVAAGYGGSGEKQQHSTQLSDEARDVHFKGNASSTSLRIGIMAANAANFLKIKNGPHIRKVGSRLTPGTVKYAAFHVLSVEGSRGLPISEIVVRIEKYSLRDFSTSKTPESSVAAALSRDTMFFDRVAPSTYCVKPAYRKNPEDAERLLQAALERIKLFQSGILDACDDEKDTEGSEEGENESLFADGAEDCALDDMHRGCNEGKVASSFKNAKIASAVNGQLGDARFVNSAEWLSNIHNSAKQGLPPALSHTNALLHDGRDRRAQTEKAFTSAFDQEIDETHAGEPWVQCLLEGEYSGLTVEDRLNALVAVVEAVNEGNTIRIALEDRMELGTALKRQMWAEAQLDRRRVKEDQVAKLLPYTSGDSAQSEGTNLSLLSRDTKSLDPLPNQSDVRKSPEGIQDYSYRESPIRGASSEKSRAQLKVDIDFRADELYIFRSLPLGLDRRRNRYWQFMTTHGSGDSGCGRIFFESSEDGHWEVIDTEEAFNALLVSLDTRGVRESHLHGVLMKLENLIRQGMRKLEWKGRLEQRLTLHDKGDRALDLSTTRNFNNILIEVGSKEEEASSDDDMESAGRDFFRHLGAIPIQTNNNQSDRTGILERYREFDSWLWSKETSSLSCLTATRVKAKRCSELLAKCDKCHDFFWHEEKHCAYCHAMFEVSSKNDVEYWEHLHTCKKLWPDSRSNEMLQCFGNTIPCRVQFLKAQLLCVEAAIPAQALLSSWSKGTRKSWASSLKDAVSASDLGQLLSELERAIQRDWLSRRFEPAKEIRQSDEEASAPCWIPCTTAAVTMRLMELDSALLYDEDQKQNTSHRRKSVPDTGPVTSKNEQTCGIKAVVLKETEIRSYSNNGSVKEARRGRSRATEYQETGKAKFQGLNKFENMLMMKNHHGMDFSANTGTLVNKVGTNIIRGSYQDSGKHINLVNFEPEVYRNTLINQEGVKPELHRSQWTGACDSRSSILGRTYVQDGSVLNRIEDKKTVVKKDLEEEDDSVVKEEDGFPSQRGCPIKKWMYGSEDDETDSVEEGIVNVSVQDDDYYSAGKEDDSHEAINLYCKNLGEMDFSDSIGSSDSESFDGSE